VFCMIGRGEMNARVVYEDEEFMAFDDITPQGPVHTLIIPKTHYASLADGIPTDAMGRLLALVPRIAEIKGISESGYRVVLNTGRDASQTVGHLHLHVVGGGPMTHGMVRFDEPRS
jgi:histidine triad (HIT) family protein